MLGTFPSNWHQSGLRIEAVPAWCVGLMLLCSGHCQVLISEFVAINSRSLADEEQLYEDWIEIGNFGPESVDLGGWHLTDAPDDLRRWAFPETRLDPGGFLVLFASGNDRRNSDRPLHTNFRLSGDGEYLALVAPDGRTVISEYADYPRQFPDVSYGITLERTTEVLVAADAEGYVYVPSDDRVEMSWIQPDFDDSAWQAATNGIGFDTGESDPLETTYAGAVLESQPMLYWRFEETTGSVSPNLGLGGSEADGAYDGNLDLGGPGPRPPEFESFEPENRALAFDGVDDFVSGPNRLLNDRATFTMVGWVRPGAEQPNRTGLWGQNDVIEFGFINSETIQLWSPAGSVSVAYPFPPNEWHHLTAVGTERELRIYFDGELAGSGAAGGANFGGSSHDFKVGGGGVFDADGNHFRGRIDEVTVWFRALGEEEIRGLLAGGTPREADFGPHIATDLEPTMPGVNSSVYFRLRFKVENPEEIGRLVLRMKYDDGFAAYLNGIEVTRANAPSSLAWNSTSVTRRPDNQAVEFQDFELTPALAALAAGDNLLALQGLNVSADNTDFLLQAELVATTVAGLDTTPRYLMSPTPGSMNRSGAGELGPLLQGVAHEPHSPSENEPLLITARVTPAFSPIQDVLLHYLVGFGSEVSVPMNDEGAEADVVSGDGIWSAFIPGRSAGELIRYYLEASDLAECRSRWPLYPSVADSERYLGTVVDDPAIESRLPVAHWHLERPASADTSGGTRGSLHFLGELYDNVLFSLHGQSSRGFPKKSYNLDFPSDHRFRYRPDRPRVKDIRLMSNWGDKARVRNVLTYEMVSAAGSDGHFSFQVRIQRNGEFFSVADMMEDGDDRWLERLGRDPRGALYKMYNNLGSASGNEKKTRRWEDAADLRSLVGTLSESRPLALRRHDAYDRIDLPQTISYFVGLALASSQDHGHKNYYLYRDSEGTGEWAIFPWDVDLSWGRNWVDRSGYFTDQLYQDNVLSFYNPSQQRKGENRFYELIFDAADFRAMYLRRLRTVMDTVLLPPGTPPADLPIEARLREMMDRMDPPGAAVSDADLDYERWGSWGNRNEMREAASRIVTEHLSGRREFLFGAAASLRGDPIPGPQPPDTELEFGAIEFSPASGNQSEEYLELNNPNAYAVDLSGWSIGGAVRFTFRPGTVIPSGGTLYVSPDVSAFRARTDPPGGGQGLFVQGDYAGQLNARGETVRLLDDAGRLVTTRTYAGKPSLAQQYLRITEMMYNPAADSGAAGDPQAFEYLELRNIGPVVLDLDGVAFTEGVRFAFAGSALTRLDPGAFVLVVADLEAFADRYGPGLPVAGTYYGRLDSNGERLRLEDAAGEPILDFEYDNAWHPLSDGLGFSLQRTTSVAYAYDPANWFASPPTPGAVNELSPIPGGDSDQDGLPDLWEENHGLDPNDARAEHGPGGDPDLDGMSNEDEFRAGTDPRNPLSALRLEFVESDHSGLVLRFPAVSQRAYLIQGRTAWDDSFPWIVVAEVPAEAVDRIASVTPTIDSRRSWYFRLLIPTEIP